MRFSPKYDDEEFVCVFIVCLVGFGGDARRAEGGKSQFYNKERLRPKFESFEMTPLFIMTSDAI